MVLTSLPLSGVRVLDLTRLLPGAFATLMLAELGADVIKIEDPGRGDPTRLLPPLMNVDGQQRALYDVLLNRGKKSVALDMRKPQSAAALSRLLDRADIVIESFRPQTSRKFGVSAEQLRASHPALIHCAITGYGQTGPYAEMPGHDLNYVSVSGLLEVDRPQSFDLPKMFIADVGGGAMSAVVAILAALYARTRTGEGASLDISMHDAALYWVMIPAARALVDGGADAEGELPTFGDHACYGIYETRDGKRLALGAMELKFWETFCAMIGRADLAARHRSSPADQRALIEDIRAVFRERTRSEWLAFFEGRDVCLSPVNTPEEALRDSHVRERGTVVPVPHGRAIRPPFVSAPPALTPAPVVGADTVSVLADAGFSAEEIASFR